GIGGQRVDVAAEQPREKRSERPVGGLVPEAPPQEPAERLVPVLASLADHQIKEGATPAATGETTPVEEVAEVARDPERRTSGIGNEPGPRPQPGAGRGRPRGLEPELTAELRRPRLPPE